jgi:environmental stress-induced protein Ves
VHPRAAGLEDFGWRISMATVASDGPFSSFPGIDRTLAILAGEGMELVIEGHGTHQLDRRSAPLPFPADAATSARLVAGTITDLNVMSRRGAFTHLVERHVFSGEHKIYAGGGVTMLLTLGDVRVDLDKNAVELGRLDALMLQGEALISSDMPTEVFIIRITACQA